MRTQSLRSSNYWSVLDTRTGRKIADCGAEEDAWALVAFSPSTRTVTRSKHLAGPVVDVAVQRVLPTSAVVPAPAPAPAESGPGVLTADGREPVRV